MILFHGSNMTVEEPKIVVSNRTLDFGAAFYTTSNLNQAINWSRLKTKRTGIGCSVVSMYEFDEHLVANLSILHFEAASYKWLDFVVRNRKGERSETKYDIVIGPVANDSTMRVINDYMAGNISEEIALMLLKPQALSDQYAFLTTSGLSTLKFVEATQYE